MTIRVPWLIAVAVVLLAGAVPDATAQDEGIKVHGQWVVEVRDPDGTLVRRAEINNSLAYAGPRLLVDVLLGNNSQGSSRYRTRVERLFPVLLARDNPFDFEYSATLGCSPVALDNLGGLQGCAVAHDALTTAWNPRGALVLTGQATLSVPATFDRVATFAYACRPSQPCTEPQLYTQSNALFSVASVNDFIVVAAGQVVTVLVTFTFS